MRLTETAAGPHEEPHKLLSTAETAELLHLPQGTLRYWRHQGRGPRGFRMGPRRVMYRKADVLAWLDQQVRVNGVGEGVTA